MNVANNEMLNAWMNAWMDAGKVDYYIGLTEGFSYV